MSNLKSHKNLTNAVNGISVRSASRNSSRSRSRSRQGSTSEYNHTQAQNQNYLLPNRADALGKHDNSISQTGSEADSLLDLYDRQSANRSTASVMEATDDKDERQDYTSADDAYWIHRDKLAQIESQELQQLGIHIPPAILAGGSRPSHGHGHARRRTRSRDSHRHLPNGSIDHSENQWTGSQSGKYHESPVEDGKADENGDPQVFEDPRLPEEIAADPHEDGGASRLYRLPVLRTSSSRIPVLSSAPRSRGNTISSRDEIASHSRSRRTSESAPRALDTPEPSQAESAPTQNSRPSSRHALNSSTTPPKGKTTVNKPTATRKASTPASARKASSTQKSRTPNNASSPRPTTRSGERPATGLNRPEGDPPWLATMYKPDPRLPPDQQILPTHARKMAQEQWEREGKVPNTYDKDFAPLAIHPDKPAPSTTPSKLPTLETPIQPPSPPPEPKPTPKTPEPPTPRPGTSGTDRYKTMPTVQPTVQPTSTATVTAGTRTRPMETEEPPVKEKSCGCCVVM